jgi:hypothetical protein
MDRNKAKELLPLIKAFSEGKTIQIRNNQGTHWVDVSNPDWTERAYWYRIKPVPREFWIVTTPSTIYYTFDDESSAGEWCNNVGGKITHVIEVV